MNVIPICLYHHPMGASKHARRATKIFKKQSITSEGSTWWLSTNRQSQKHSVGEISCMSSWAGPVNSRRGRRWSCARCLPKDKRYINKQRPRKRSPPFLPAILLCLHNTACVFVCMYVCGKDGGKSQVNEFKLYRSYLGCKSPELR